MSKMDMASKMKDFSARRQAGKKAKAKKLKVEPVAVTIVHEDGPSNPMGDSDYERTKAKERKEHGGFDKYKVESACETLEKAHEIMADPKLMAAVGQYHKKKAKKITSIVGLRAKAAAMDGDGDE